MMGTYDNDSGPQVGGKKNYSHIHEVSQKHPTNTDHWPEKEYKNGKQL